MTLETTVPIAPADTADVPVLASVLANAFQDDPLFSWGIPDPTRRRVLLPGVFAAFADVFLPHDETYMTADGTGVAMWAPAGVDPFEGAAAEAFGERLGYLLGEDAERCLEVGEIFGRYQPPQPWMYLQLMGVIPEQQGHGKGSQLLQGVLERCDATGLPAYLEASSPDNRRLYERHGFRVTDAITLPDGGPTVWGMWREPQGSERAR